MEPPTDDYGLIAPISLPPDGHAPGGVSGPAEYDGFFRIHHTEVSDAAWVTQVLSVTRGVTDDLPDTTLDEAERADLLDGITLLLQHALHVSSDQ
ncbi:hypothetical protein [Streptomyces violascens]|jgi:hypothetical protein|uniref:Uncharacterized protein n=1 Tax=Streptomyces violascens TaxID=67381 RepID=A0ABQ3QT43_9ACTN|nr:hypothetical protein [Streptomyces violascens]GHI40461.1 hypothetical protein Sviol_48690 [Streptomyces violascens]